MRWCTAAGQVVYTGSSSLDIRLTLGQTHRDAPSITALVTFVARDPATGRATRVNPLVPDTDEQRRWYAERQEVARARKAARAAASAAPGGAAGGPDEHATRRAWAQRLLTEARAMRTMPGAHVRRRYNAAVFMNGGGRGRLRTHACAPVCTCIEVTTHIRSCIGA